LKENETALTRVLCSALFKTLGYFEFLKVYCPSKEAMKPKQRFFVQSNERCGGGYCIGVTAICTGAVCWESARDVLLEAIVSYKNFHYTLAVIQS
jgi:hypothetical protein